MRSLTRFLFFLIILFSHDAVLFSTEMNIAQEALRQITVDVFIIDIMKIDDTEQSITIDFGVRLTWKDESLAGKFTKPKLIGPGQIWKPDMQILNELDLKRKRREVLQVFPDGTVNLRQRFQGKLSTRVDFRDFPIDEQRFGIQMVAPLQDNFVFISGDTLTGQMETFSIPDWEIGQGELVIRPIQAAGYSLNACAYQFTAKRRLGYYIWKVFLPLTVVIMMSWLVFWVDPSHIGAQLDVAATAMLAMIAFQFALSHMLPRLPYFTRLDLFVAGANIIVFLALFEAVLTSKLVDSDRKELARKSDRVAQVVFPMIYILILVSAFVI